MLDLSVPSGSLSSSGSQVPLVNSLSSHSSSGSTVSLAGSLSSSGSHSSSLCRGVGGATEAYGSLFVYSELQVRWKKKFPYDLFRERGITHPRVTH